MSSSHKYSRVAAVVLLVYDYCLTFNDQILFLSQRPLRLIHALFLISRYLPFVAAPIIVYESISTNLDVGTKTCWALYLITGASLWDTVLAAEGLLVIRTIALCHDSPNSKKFLIGGLLLLCLWAVVLTVYMLVKQTNDTSFLLSLANYNCLPSVTDPMTIANVAGDALFELFVCQFTIRYGMIRCRRPTYSPGRLQTTLAIGNLLYSVPLCAVSTANALVVILPPTTGWSETLIIYQGILHSVLGSRILFNLREAGDLSQEDDTMEMQPRSRLYFNVDIPTQRTELFTQS